MGTSKPQKKGFLWSGDSLEAKEWFRSDLRAELEHALPNVAARLSAADLDVLVEQKLFPLRLLVWVVVYDRLEGLDGLSEEARQLLTQKVRNAPLPLKLRHCYFDGKWFRRYEQDNAGQSSDTARDTVTWAMPSQLVKTAQQALDYIDALWNPKQD